MNDKLLTRREAANFLGVSYGTINRWLVARNDNPPFAWVGGRAKYRTSDLEEWMNKKFDVQRNQGSEDPNPIGSSEP